MVKVHIVIIVRQRVHPTSINAATRYKTIQHKLESHAKKTSTMSHVQSLVLQNTMLLLPFSIGKLFGSTG